MARAYNFSDGPATLPEPVLRQAQEEMLDWHGAGASIVELSHRSSEFIGVAARAEADLRALLPGLHALGLFQVLTARDPALQHLIDGAA